MTQIRDKSHVVLWLFLIVFILSMIAGGLLGGANIVDLIFGGTDPSRYAGWIENRGITHQEFQNYYNSQLSSSQQQNRTIDGRTSQTASNNAWNLIVNTEFRNKKINDLDLLAQENEIYEFLLYTPPPAFQNVFINSGMFVDDENNFVLEDYQEAIKNGDLPEELNSVFARWETYLKDWLGNRKLQNLYNKASTVSDLEVKLEYLKNNINCNIDYIFINTNKIASSDIIITDEDVENEYHSIKEEKYKNPSTKTINYVAWKIPNEIKLDTLNTNSYIDSLNNEALLFADEADVTSFNDAASKFNYTIDTLKIHEGFNSNSGFPFLMGTSRAAVRFVFDNPIGSISDPIEMDNQIIVINILNENSEGYKDLSEVSQSIKSSLTQSKKKEYAINLINEKVDSELNWEQLASEDSTFQLLLDQDGLINGSFKDIGTSNELKGALLGMKQGDISNVITTYNAVCKIKLNSKDEFNTDSYEEAYSDLKTQLINRKNNSNYGIWLNDIKENSTINDYRSKTY
tara:strand:+ start:92 stop:1639 length:1548 start_codon:yes stop_codon:yes gene_type:complete